MTRPLYPYPLRAVYKGDGDTTKADSFVLLEQQPAGTRPAENPQ